MPTRVSLAPPLLGRGPEGQRKEGRGWKLQVHQEVIKPRVSCCETEKGTAPPPTVFLPKMFNLNLTVRKQSGISKLTYFATQLAWGLQKRHHNENRTEGW